MSRDKLTGKTAERIIIDDPWATAQDAAETIARLAGISASEIPVGKITGFDVSSGPDYSAAATIRVGKDYSFTVEDIEFHEPPTGMMDQMREFARKQQDEVFKAMMGDQAWWHQGDPRPRPEHWNCRSRMDPHWGDGTRLSEDERDLINGRFRGNEIIVSEDDQRGLSARQVKGRQL